jgi:hypothetical protein
MASAIDACLNSKASAAGWTAQDYTLVKQVAKLHVGAFLKPGLVKYVFQAVVKDGIQPPTVETLQAAGKGGLFMGALGFHRSLIAHFQVGSFQPFLSFKL